MVRIRFMEGLKISGVVVFFTNARDSQYVAIPMPAAPLTPDEPARLQTLRGLHLLDTPKEVPWDSLVRCAASLTGCPTSLVTLVDESRQWFKARVGMGASETSREAAFCAHAILDRELLEVADARMDPRFCDSPLVTVEGGIRFYAGVPLVVDGHPMGTLCVIDQQPRTLNAAQRVGLADLACVAEQLLISHRTQNDLVLARRAAEAASEAKSAFLATMSHESRTSMSGVLGFLELLQRTSLDANQMDLAATVRESAEALLPLIDDVVDFSKIQSGQMSLVFEPLELRRLVASVLQATASARHVSLWFECADDLAPWIESDAARLRQVLNNLVGNAIKFCGGCTGGGQVLVLASAVQTEKGPHLHLQIIDNGIGMTSEMMAHIFKPFVPGEDSTARLYGGNDPDLSICQRLAHLLGGWIGVDSTPGKGSTFIVHLPLRPCAAPAQAAHAEATDDSVVGMMLCGARVLVAEDNSINQNVIRRQLAMLGVDMDLAVDGEDALKQWREGRHQGCHALLLRPSDAAPGRLLIGRAHPRRRRRQEPLAHRGNVGCNHSRRARTLSAHWHG